MGYHIHNMDIKKLLELLNNVSQNQNFDVEDSQFEFGQTSSDSFQDVLDEHPFFQGLNFDTKVPKMNNLLYDVVTEDENVVVVADLPGFTEDQINLQADELQVRINATATDDMRRESISHTFRLPEEVVPEEADATFENGVLTITLPRLNVDDSDGQTRIDIS